MDPSTAASLRAFERALDWYAEEVHFAENPPISAAAAASLRAVANGKLPLCAGQFEVLVKFAHTMFLVGRKAPEVPTCTLGDALTALATRDGREGERWVWQWDPVLDAEGFAKLRFGEASAGIAKLQQANRAGWQAHAERNRAFILDAARECSQRQLAVVLGAGQAFDLPLLELARAFDRVVLVDIDGSALEQTISRTILDPGLRARIEPRVLDLSGMNGQLVRAVDQLLGGAGSAQSIAGDLAELCRSYRLVEAPALLATNERADLLVSGLVLSQVSWPQRVYALGLYEQRFGKLSGEAERSWIGPWWELELQVQQAHIASLAGCAERVVLCSDVLSRPTLLDESGVERETGRKIFALGVAELQERVPTGFQIERGAAWPWHRYRASRRGALGSLMDVEGLVLSPRFR